MSKPDETEFFPPTPDAYTGGGRDWQGESLETPDQVFARTLQEVEKEQARLDEEIDQTLAEIEDILERQRLGTLDYTAAAGTLLAHEEIIVEALRMYRS